MFHSLLHIKSKIFAFLPTISSTIKTILHITLPEELCPVSGTFGTHRIHNRISVLLPITEFSIALF